MHRELAILLNVGMLVRVHIRLITVCMMTRLMRMVVSGYMRNGKRIPIKLFSMPMAVKAQCLTRPLLVLKVILHWLRTRSQKLVTPLLAGV